MWSQAWKAASEVWVTRAGNCAREAATRSRVVHRRRLTTERPTEQPRNQPFPPEVEAELNTPIIFAKYPNTVKYGTFAFTAALTFHTVLFVDFGSSEHCFSPVRRWVEQQRQLLWAPAPEEEQILRTIESSLNLGDASSDGGSPAVGTSGAR